MIIHSFDIITQILLGLGLMFTGVYMLSLGIRQAGSRKFRAMASGLISNRWKALVFGIGSGVVMQSTSAALMILASLISSGILSVSQAIEILTGFSVGNTALLFLVSLKINEFIIVLIGICGISLAMLRQEKIRNTALIGLGIGLIFFGIDIMTSGVKPLRSEEWFIRMMETGSEYSFLSILVGLVLGFIAQSSTAVAMVAIGLAKAGIFGGSQAFLFIYGAAIGSTLFKVLLGQTFRGTSLRLVRFVNIFNIFGAVLFILLFYLESWLKIPLVQALLNHISPNLEMQVSLAFLLFNLTSAVIFTAFNQSVSSWLTRTIPATVAESLAQPEFIADFSPGDPESGLSLIVLEQGREVREIAGFFASAREKENKNAIGITYPAFLTLAGEVSAALQHVASMHLHPVTARDHAECQARQTLITQLASSSADAIRIINASAGKPLLGKLSVSCLESIDFMMNLAVETMGTDNPEDKRLLKELTSGNSPAMEKIRQSYLHNSDPASAGERGELLDLTILTEKIIWLLNRMISIGSDSIAPHPDSIVQGNTIG